MFILLSLLDSSVVILFKQIGRAFRFFLHDVIAAETATHAELADFLLASKAGLLLGTASLLHDPRHVHGHKLLDLGRLDCLSPARLLQRIYRCLHLTLDRYATRSLHARSHGSRRKLLSRHGLWQRQRLSCISLTKVARCTSRELLMRLGGESSLLLAGCKSSLCSGPCERLLRIRKALILTLEAAAILAVLVLRLLVILILLLIWRVISITG